MYHIKTLDSFVFKIQLLSTDFVSQKDVLSAKQISTLLNNSTVH